MYSDQYYDGEYNDYYGGHSSAMATASFVLGLVAVFSCSVLLTALVLGSLSILCALLSRSDHMPKKSRIGVVASIAAIVISSVLTWRSVSTIMTDPQLREYYKQYAEQLLEQYGLTDQENSSGGSPIDRILGGDDSTTEPDIAFPPFGWEEEPLPSDDRYTSGDYVSYRISGTVKGGELL